MASLLLRSLGKSTCVLCSKSAARPMIFQPMLQSCKSVGRRFVILGSALSEGQSARHRKIIGGWLLGCAGMVYGAVALGGVTRLTESGLSMVDWSILKGMRPPLSQQDWEAEFAKYKQFPEYGFKKGLDEVSLEEFKFIWMMEYTHRMWGRAIGLVFLLPCAYFWARGRFTAPMKKRMVFAGSLLLGQGLLGWWMVKSGLDPSQNTRADVPTVSQYRLAAHLSSAVILYTVFLWTGLSHVLKPYDHTHLARIGTLRALAHSSKTWMFLTIVMGAFVAGLDAGLVYNSWPKFADRWIPEGLWTKEPKWKNLFENQVTVQFIHRELVSCSIIMAYITLASITATWLVGRRMALSPRAKVALHSLMVMGYTQAVLGIVTLVTYVPVWLGALHQSGSMALITFAFWLTNELRRVPK